MKVGDTIRNRIREGKADLFSSFIFHLKLCVASPVTLLILRKTHTDTPLTPHPPLPDRNVFSVQSSDKKADCMQARIWSVLLWNSE